MKRMPGNNIGTHLATDDACLRFLSWSLWCDADSNYDRLIVQCNKSLFLSLQENRIYDLKKKNEELEKFKFVLDYKVNELKKQIEPRENEVKEMKEQVHEVRRVDLYLQIYVPYIRLLYQLCLGHAY